MLGWLAAGVVAMNVYAVALIWLRSLIYRTRLYRPMLLNVGLSVAPTVVLALTLVALIAMVETVPSTVLLWLILVAGGMVWLVLLPNAGYLITELNMSHRRTDDPVPLWFDIVAVLSLTMSGVLNTMVNVILAQLIAAAIIVDPETSTLFRVPWMWVVAVVTLWLVSFGIYLGRYLRFNSWDLRHPPSFARKVVSHFREPGRIAAGLLFCVLHTIFFMIVYLVVVTPVATLLTR